MRQKRVSETVSWACATHFELEIEDRGHLAEYKRREQKKTGKGDNEVDMNRTTVDYV